MKKIVEFCKENKGLFALAVAFLLYSTVSYSHFHNLYENIAASIFSAVDKLASY